MSYFKAKCTKFDFSWQRLQRSLSPLAGFKGPTSQGKERRGREGGREEKEMGLRGGEEKGEGEERGKG